MDIAANMPFNFLTLLDKIMPLLGNVICSIAPYMLIYGLGTMGINRLSEAFGGKVRSGKDAAKPWDGHSDAMYEWYKESIERKGQEHFDEHAPEWVKQRMEYEQTYDQLVEKERAKHIHKMVEQDVKRDIESGKDVFGQKKFTPAAPATEKEEWFGDEETDDEDEDEFSDLPF